ARACQAAESAQARPIRSPAKILTSLTLCVARRVRGCAAPDRLPPNNLAANQYVARARTKIGNRAASHTSTDFCERHAKCLRRRPQYASYGTGAALAGM